MMRAATLALVLVLSSFTGCRDDGEPRGRAAERTERAHDDAPRTSPSAALDEAAVPATTGVVEPPDGVGNALDDESEQLLYQAATAIQRERAIPSKVKRRIQIGVTDGRLIVKGDVPDAATYDLVDEILEKIAPVQNELVVPQPAR